MNVLRVLGLVGLLGFCQTSLAQTCPVGHPRVAPDDRYQVGEPVSGEFVVSDLATGLMWKRCSEGQSGACCSTGSATTHTWSEALTLASSASHAGFSDWRLPNREELRSLVETACFDPSINTAIFPATAPSHYGSSTTYVFNASSMANANFAWSVIFYDGTLGGLAKHINRHVRLVRGGNALDPFAAEADSVPDPFSLLPQTGVPVSTLRTSDPISVVGLTTVTGIGVSGAVGSRYSINGGSFTSQPGAVADGDLVQVQHTSAGTSLTATTTTLTVGGVTADFVSVTELVDSVFANGFE